MCSTKGACGVTQATSVPIEDRGKRSLIVLRVEVQQKKQAVVPVFLTFSIVVQI